MSTIAYIRYWISRKPLQIEAWFQRTTNRKRHNGLSNGHLADDVTWHQRCCEAVRSAILGPAWLLVIVSVCRRINFISSDSNSMVLLRCSKLWVGLEISNDSFRFRSESDTNNLSVNFLTIKTVTDWLSMVLRLRQHNIGYTADGFYRSDDPTNSVKALKEGG